jgi:hypothetical protein
MIKLTTIIKTYWIALTLVILGAISILSLSPLDTLPSVPGTDKAHHLIAYALLMFPAALRKPDRLLTIGLLFIAWSGTIELVQPYVNRYGEWLDLLANTGGIACGFLIATLINSWITRREA